MSRITPTFERLRRAGRRGFIAYLTAGDPSLAYTREYVRRLADAGADLVELGLAFSDPLADGRVNQAAAERALAAGATLDRVLETVRELRGEVDIPLVLYSYLNPLLARGFERTVARIAEAGFDGLLPLDLPPEEAAAFQPAISKVGLDRIALVAPTSDDARVARIVRGAGGFVYCISRAGVTGARDRLSEDAAEVVRRARRHTSLPLALGFGISTPEQAGEAARLADAVVVGSALVERLHRACGDATARADVFDWVAKMAEAVHAA